MTTYYPFYPQYVGPPETKAAKQYRPQMTGDAGRIMRELADAYKITVEELSGPSTAHRIARPRQELMWRLHETGRYSLHQIGTFLGGRDHTTVRHGVLVHAGRMGAANGAH